ncbi:MAG: hypothetical protein ABI303_03130 [Candidatus Saccharimonas sp.]
MSDVLDMYPSKGEQKHFTAPFNPMDGLDALANHYAFVSTVGEFERRPMAERNKCLARVLFGLHHAVLQSVMPRSIAAQLPTAEVRMSSTQAEELKIKISSENRHESTEYVYRVDPNTLILGYYALRGKPPAESETASDGTVVAINATQAYRVLKLVQDAAVATSHPNYPVGILE